MTSTVIQYKFTGSFGRQHNDAVIKPSGYYRYLVF